MQDHNTIAIAEIKRRGMAAIDDGLRRGPVYIVRRKKMAAVVLSEDEYQRLTNQKLVNSSGVTAMQWLLSLSTTGKRSKEQIDAVFKVERAY
jgi:PHD/YefM family antitoxin component YafN of YafNO toxin-antitoxin module